MNHSFNGPWDGTVGTLTYTGLIIDAATQDRIDSAVDDLTSAAKDTRKNWLPDGIDAGVQCAIEMDETTKAQIGHQVACMTRRVDRISRSWAEAKDPNSYVHGARVALSVMSYEMGELSREGGAGDPQAALYLYLSKSTTDDCFKSLHFHSCMVRRGWGSTLTILKETLDEVNTANWIRDEVVLSHLYAVASTALGGCYPSPS